MTAGERFKSWIDGLAESWKDRLRGWMMSWVAKGAEELLDDLEPELVAQVREQIDEILLMPELPPAVRTVFERVTAPKGFAPAIILIPLAISLLITPIMTALNPFMRKLGFSVDKGAQSFRLDPGAVITAWRRDKPKYEKLFDDLKDQGWSEDRIEALKFYSQAYPALADVIRFYAREAFEPDMIAKYGLDEETPPYEGTLFEKLGVPKDISDLYWIAHWEHASFIQVREMLHRGLLTGSKEVPPEPVGYDGWASRDAEGEKEMYQWYRVVEIPPIWRSLLTESLWNVPTRVDVRRWWDMRTVSEEEMISIYHRQGYHGKDLENYIRWTKVYTDFPMMMSRFTKGWITEEDIRVWLRGLEIPEDRINQFIQEKTKPEAPERVTKERDLTKTDIIKGVKKEVISHSQGIELLMDLGYSEDEADYVIAINLAAEAGSPETFEEFKDITTRYKIAIGKEAKPMPEELIAAAQELARVTKEVEALERSIVEEERGLIPGEVLPEAATAKLDELRIILHRAESELARVKSDYLGKLAEWRHGV